MPVTPENSPETYDYIRNSIRVARNQGNMELVDALLDLWTAQQQLAGDYDAKRWGFNPKKWADPTDLAAFNRMPWPGLSRLRA